MARWKYSEQKLKEINEKRRETNLKKYGVENVSSSIPIKSKKKHTCLEKYGVENPQQSSIVREKTKQTCLDVYGVENPQQSLLVKSKKAQTMLKKFGVLNSSQIHYTNNMLEVLNSFEYLYNEYIEKNKTTIQIGNSIGVNSNTVARYLRKHGIVLYKLSNYSKKAIQWLDMEAAKHCIYIQHALNMGEYRIPNTKYYVDGYCSSNNTIYEFYGDRFHGNLSIFSPDDCPHPFNLNITALKLHNKTIERENRIKELGYNLITIWENEFAI